MDWSQSKDKNQEGYSQPGGYPSQPGYPQTGGYFTQSGSPQGGYPPPQSTFQPAGYGGGSRENLGYAPSNTNNLGEDGEVKGFDFTEKSIRRAFIRKVYSILMCQLLVTTAAIALFLFHQPTKIWVMRTPWLIWMALGVVFVCLIMMSCCGDLRRQAPTNFIFLGIFTVAESFLLGVISSRYNIDSVLMAMGITAAVCFALTIFALQTKWDFTAMGGILLCATVVLIVFGIILLIIGTSKIMNVVYSSVGALLFSVYLVYDTQLIMGGKHKYSTSPEEYVFAALNLYLDVIHIFLYILRIIGGRG